jgi:Subtilase family
VEEPGTKRERVVHHLPGDVLIVLERSPEQLERSRARAEAAAAPGVLAEAQEAPEDEVHAALEQAVNGWLGNTRPQLRRGDRSGASQSRRVHRFTQPEGPTTEIHHFRIDEETPQVVAESVVAGVAAEDPRDVLNERLYAVTQMVSNLNQHLRPGMTTARAALASDDSAGEVPGTIHNANGEELGTVRAVTPNWLSTSAQGWGTGGGPGLPPEPIEPGPRLPSPGISFGTKKLQKALTAEANEKQPVVVVVLDTSPNPEAARKAAKQFLYSAGNTFLDWVTRSIYFEDGPLPQGVLEEFSHIVPFWAERMHNWHPHSTPEDRDTFFNIVDHGLFAAGLIRSIAPEVEIHLLRVLDDVGVGDMRALLTALNSIPERFLNRKPRPRVIVNLSLLVEEPEDPDGHKAYGVDTASELHLPLQIAVDMLRQQGILVVAAVGNDSLNTRTGSALKNRAKPRLPSRYETVLSVAATDKQGKASTYSNLGDFDVLTNGIAVYGGNAAMTAGLPALAPAEQDGGPPDGLVGAFTRELLPCDKGINQTGLVYWAGTSFAAPIITGLTAQLWSRAKAPAKPEKLIEKLRGFATLNEIAALQCKAIATKH